MRVQRPALSSAVWKWARLAAASMSPNACSATMGAVLPGMLHTTMPRSRAATRSKESVPMPHTVAIRSRGNARSASRGHLIAPRVFTRQTASRARASFSSGVAGRSVWSRTSP